MSRAKIRQLKKLILLAVLGVIDDAVIVCKVLPLLKTDVVTPKSKTHKIMKVYLFSNKLKKNSSKSVDWLWNDIDFCKSLVFSKFWIVDLTCCCPQRLICKFGYVFRKKLENLNLFIFYSSNFLKLVVEKIASKWVILGWFWIKNHLSWLVRIYNLDYLCY